MASEDEVQTRGCVELISTWKPSANAFAEVSAILGGSLLREFGRTVCESDFGNFNGLQKQPEVLGIFLRLRGRVTMQWPSPDLNPTAHAFHWLKTKLKPIMCDVYAPAFRLDLAAKNWLPSIKT